jgi:hypothetical protein
LKAPRRRGVFFFGARVDGTPFAMPRFRRPTEFSENFQKIYQAHLSAFEQISF